jgi:outer membrane protein
MRMRTRWRALNWGIAGLMVLALPLTGFSRQQSITIQQAVERAVSNYPAITVSQEQINAAAAGIQLARTAYLPRLDSLAQFNRATRNNVFGLLLPQSVLPSISGPVLGSNNAGSVWSSAVGGLVTWEPFDFGLRSAGVSAATAAKARAESALKRTQFEIAVATADAYLTLAAAQETVRAAQAAQDRSDVLVRTTQAQVEAQLRPGADTSRAQAELAATRTQLARAQQAVDTARAVLAQFVGLPPQQIVLTTARLLQLPPEQNVAQLNASANPVAAEQNAVVEQMRAELKVLDKSYVPRFHAQGSAFARGSGAELNGDRLGGFNGLAPTTQNYALGFSVTFPIFDRSAIRAKEDILTAKVRSETARYQQISTDLTAHWNAAAAALEGSRKVAANTPAQTAAAGAAAQQAEARYQAGLGTLVEVADSQRLVTQAAIDDALAHLGVWRGLLGVAAATGDIQPFLAEASR